MEREREREGGDEEEFPDWVLGERGEGRAREGRRIG